MAFRWNEYTVELRSGVDRVLGTVTVSACSPEHALAMVATATREGKQAEQLGQATISRYTCEQHTRYV